MSSRVLSSIRTALLTGVLVLAPLVVTTWVFLKLVGLADGLLLMLPPSIQPEQLVGVPLPGLGVLLTIVVVGTVGYAMRSYTGRRVVEIYERLLARVPGVSNLYQGVKQLFETVFSSKGKNFRQVVLVEYPRRDAWCLAFVTSPRSPVTAEVTGEELVSVFMPTTPNPTSGYYLLVPVRDLRFVDLSVEEAFKLIMSAGIVLPPTPAGLVPRKLLPAPEPAPPPGSPGA